jgi:hypothetical protein
MIFVHISSKQWYIEIESKPFNPEGFMKKLLAFAVLIAVVSCSNPIRPVENFPAKPGEYRMYFSPAVGSDTTEYHYGNFDYFCIAPLSAYVPQSVKMIYAKWRTNNVEHFDSIPAKDGESWIPNQ